MKLNFYKIILVGLLLVSPGLTFQAAAAAMGMGMGPPCGGPFPPCPIPLDSGVALLLFAGAAYGGKKIYDSLKKNPA